MTAMMVAHSSARAARPAQASCVTLAEEILEAESDLGRRLRGRLWDATIIVHPEGVILQGRASSYYVKQLAQHAVMKHVSQPIAANEIEVTSIS